MFHFPDSSSSSQDSLDSDFNLSQVPLNRVLNNIDITTRPILRNLRNRLESNSLTSANNYFFDDSFSAGPNFLRNRRRRVFINEGYDHNLDDNTHSQNRECFDEEYIDFRYYPLPINWYDCDERNFGFGCELFELYGNFGLSLFTKLKYIKLPVDPEAFMKNLVEYYYNEKFYEKNESVNLFVQNLPKLEKINEIIKKKLYTDKDLLPIKLVLDIYENYYKNDILFYEIFKKDFYPTVNEFYISLSYEQLDKLYIKLVNERGYFKKVAENKIVIFKRRDKYLDYYKNLKSNLMMLYEGINKNSFIL